MKKSLFNIQEEYQLLAEQLIESGGESSEEMEIALRINREDLETKGTNYGMVCKQLEYETNIIDAEIDRLDKLKKARKNTIERLKTNLSTAMQVFEIKELKTPLLTINFRKSESVEIDNMAQLDAKFIVEKVTTTPDKTAIKKAIQAGEEVAGAHISVNQNIQIK